MLNIRKMELRDREIYMVMVQDFYRSPAVLAPVPISNMEAGCLHRGQVKSSVMGPSCR